MTTSSSSPIILAFSGGLDTSFCVPWLKETYARPVVTVCINTGGLDDAAAQDLEARAMALGAQGVWCGSVWLTTDEAETHPVVKEKFLAATSADTIRSRSLTGKHARMLKSAWTEEWDREDTPDPLGMPLQPILTAAAQRRIDRASHHAGSGAEKLSNYFVGQIVGNMNQRKTSTQVVMDMVEEFIDAVDGLKGYLDY